jgi:phosphoglycolate phosphatase
MNGMLGRRELPLLSSERYAQIFGFPVKEYYHRVGWIFEDEPFEKLSDEFIDEYEHRKLECPLREGSVNILRRNSEKGIQQSIISASKESSVVDMVKFFGVEDLFVGVRGLDDHHAFGKTDIGIQWITELALDPESIIMVGDSVHDHEVAQAMGVECVLVVSGHQDYARLSTCGVPVIQSLGEIYL